MEMLNTLSVLLVAYLLGSFPSAYLVTRRVTHLDIRQLGDQNTGARNTFLAAGWLPGILVGIIDVGKGALSVVAARYCGASENVVMLAGACAVLGHDFPIYLHFRGGQGMAALVGVLGVLYPYPTALALSLFIVILVISRNWDFSCATGFILLVTLLWLSGQPPKRLLYPVLLLPTIGLKKLLQLRQARDAVA